MQVLLPFFEEFVFLNYLFVVIFVFKFLSFQLQKSHNWKLKNFFYFTYDDISLRKSRKTIKILQNVLSSLLAAIILCKILLVIVLSE